MSLEGDGLGVYGGLQCDLNLMSGGVTPSSVSACVPPTPLFFIHQKSHLADMHHTDRTNWSTLKMIERVLHRPVSIPALLTAHNQLSLLCDRCVGSTVEPSRNVCYDREQNVTVRQLRRRGSWSPRVENTFAHVSTFHLNSMCKRIKILNTVYNNCALHPAVWFTALANGSVRLLHSEHTKRRLLCRKNPKWFVTKTPSEKYSTMQACTQRVIWVKDTGVPKAYEEQAWPDTQYHSFSLPPFAFLSSTPSSSSSSPSGCIWRWGGRGSRRW